MKIWRGLTVVPLRAVPARLARRPGRTRRMGDGTGAPATLPWAGRAPRWGHGPGPPYQLASTGSIKLTVPSWLPGGEEATRGRPWHWSRCWLHSIGERVADDPEAVL